MESGVGGIAAWVVGYIVVSSFRHIMVYGMRIMDTRLVNNCISFLDNISPSSLAAKGNIAGQNGDKRQSNLGNVEKRRLRAKMGDLRDRNGRSPPEFLMSKIRFGGIFL